MHPLNFLYFLCICTNSYGEIGGPFIWTHTCGPPKQRAGKGREGKGREGEGREGKTETEAAKNLSSLNFVNILYQYRKLHD